MKINHNYIAGFVQGDGCFSITIIKKKNKLTLRPVFTIVQHKEFKQLIIKIQEEFNGIGNWYLNKQDNTIRYQVTKLNDIKDIIIPFFDKYQLRSNKYESYLKFKFIVNKLSMLTHLKDKSYDISNLINIIITMNPLNKNLRYIKLNNSNLINDNNNLNNLNNLNLNLKTLDSNIINKESLTIDFINGLFDADGNIAIYFSKYKLNKIIIRLTYSIVQDIYNESLLYEIKNYFNNIGNIYKIGDKYSRYDVKSIKNIKDILLPKILEEHPLNIIIKRNKLINT